MGTDAWLLHAIERMAVVQLADMQGFVLQVKGRLEELLGVSIEEVLERPLESIFCSNANDDLYELGDTVRQGRTQSRDVGPRRPSANGRTERPDLIVLDIDLPGINGYDGLEALRRIPATQSIPVIALSASAMERDVRRALQAGFTRYLTKPVKIEALYEALEELVVPR